MNCWKRFNVVRVLATLILPMSETSLVDAATGAEVPVDLSTGDLNYRIDLLQVPVPGGQSFPLALKYNSGIKVRPEASWVGLGFTLEAGSVFRERNGVPDDLKNRTIYLRNTNQVVSRAEITSDPTRSSILNAEFDSHNNGNNQRVIDGGGGIYNHVNRTTKRIEYTAANWFQVYRRDYDLSYYGYLYSDQTGRNELDHNYTEGTLPPNKVHISEGHIGLDEGTIDHAWPKFPLPQKDDFFCTSADIVGNFQAFKKGKAQFLPSNLSFHKQVTDTKFIYSPDYVKSTNPATDYVFRYLDDPGGFHHQESYYDSYDNTRKGTLNHIGSKVITPTYNATTGLIERFTILNSDGFTYEFGIPVYQKDEYSEVSDLNVAGIKSSGSKYASSSTTPDGILGNTPFYASEWLLTKITGPDYSDANGNGTPDPADKGYWIKFSYQKTSDQYNFRYPFSGREVPPSYSVNTNSDYVSGGNPIKLAYSVQYGRREVYYLRNIETASHIAVFEIASRQDGFEHGAPTVGTTTMGSASLYRLDEIALYNRRAFNTDFNGNGFWDKSDAVEFSLKRVRFTFDYSLANGAPNSKAGGKLTLRSLGISDNALTVTYPYSFDYLNNYTYNEMHFDRWGYHKSDATFEEHLAVRPEDTKAWSLNKITLPAGGSIEIDYESDSYTHIYDKGVNGAMDTYNDHKDFYETEGRRNGEVAPFWPEEFLVKSPDYNTRPECERPYGSCFVGFSYREPEAQHVEGQPLGFIDGKNVRPVSNFFQRPDCWDQSALVFEMNPAPSCWEPSFLNYDFRGYDEIKWATEGDEPPDELKNLAGTIQIRHSGYGSPVPGAGQRLVRSVPGGQSRDMREAIFDIKELPQTFQVGEIEIYAMFDQMVFGSQAKGRIELYGGNNLSNWTLLAATTSPGFELYRWVHLRYSGITSYSKFKIKTIGVNSSGTLKEIGQKDLRIYVQDGINPDLAYDKLGGGVRVKKLTYREPISASAKVIDLSYENSYVLTSSGPVSSGNATTEPPIFTHDDNNDRKIHSGQTTGLLLPAPKVIYGEVKLTYPGNGKEIHTFLLPKDAKNLARQYWRNELGLVLSAPVQLPSGHTWGREYYLKYIDNSSSWGLPKNIEVYNESNVATQRTAFTYLSSIDLPKDNRNGFIYEENRIFQKDPSDKWHSYTSAQIRNNYFLKSKQETLDKVTRSTHYDFPEDRSGKPMQVSSENSNGKTKVIVNKPAHTAYAGMAQKNMLVQECQQSILEMPPGTTVPVDVSGNLSRVVSSSVTTWSDQAQLSAGVWRPSSDYVWKEKMWYSGLPMSNFVDFMFCSSCSNDASKWLRLGKQDAFDKFGRAMEYTHYPDNASMNTADTEVYGYKGALLTGQIRNAGYREAGIFTAGYIDGENGYLDYRNGWEMGGTTSNVSPSTTFPLFGSSNIRIDYTYGPTRNNKVYPGKEYILTAWVRVQSGSLVMAGDFRSLKSQYEASENQIWPIGMDHLNAADPAYPAYSKTVTPKSPIIWEKVELRFRTDNLPSDKKWYTRLFVGNPGGGVAFVQDIRILPSEATGTSIYYNSPLLLKEMELDANANPGRRVKYDGFGRPTHAYQVDVVNSVYQGDKLAKTMEYSPFTP